MRPRITRRRLLASTAALPGLSGVVGAATPDARSESDRFAAVEHAYGFRNWSTKDQYFDAPEDPHRSAIRERIRSEWRQQAKTTLGRHLDVGSFSAPLVDAIATQLREAVVQRAGTNGHCYGMVLTAQRYFERPETIPVDRASAAEIEDPTVPIGAPETPVYDEIVRRQADQFLRFRVWLGRRALLYRNWIDTGAVLSDVMSVIDAFGTAPLLLFNDTQLSHLVLAYGYEDRDDEVKLSIYDPNLPAPAYHERTPALYFERGDALSMQPYRKYTGVLFNQYDRIEEATDRETATPLDHLTVGRQRLREAVAPLALVATTAADVDLVVTAPDGTEIERIHGTHIDRGRGKYGRMRARYGAEPGTYRVRVFGSDAARYELRALVADVDGGVVDATRRARVQAGAVHEYDLVIPAEGEGRLTRVGTRFGGRTSVDLLGAGAVGAGVGALGYRAIDRLRRDH